MYRSDDVTRGNSVGKCALLTLTAIAALCLGAAQTALGQVPGAVISSATGIGGIDSYGSTISHIAANSRGDVFIGAINGSTFSIEEYPAGSTAAVTLVSGTWSHTYDNVGVAVDAAGNVYAANPESQQIIFIPFVNGSYPSGVAYSSLSYCGSGNFPFATQGLTTACTGFHYLPSAYGYYLQFIDVGIDGSGNMYTLSKYTGGTTSSTGYANGQNMIVEWPASGGSNVLLADNLPNQGSAEMAVDKAGDIYYVDSTARATIQYMAAGSTAILAGTTVDNTLPATFGSGFTQPTGVSVDASGNVYVTDEVASSGSTTVVSPSNRIVEFPNIGGTVSAANQYTLSNELNSGNSSYSNQTSGHYGPSTGVGIDGYGNIYYAGAYPNSLNKAIIGKASFGYVALGNTSSAQTLNVSFPAGTTFGSTSVFGPFSVSSSTCIATDVYAVDSVCTISITFTPTAAGPQSGQVSLYDNSSNLLGTISLSGSGTAAVLDVDPGTISSIGSSWTAPNSIAVDASGNTYVVDLGKVYKAAAGGGTPAAVDSGLNLDNPTAIAIDIAGNLYVAQTGSSTNEVVEIPYANNTYGTPVVLISGLSGASGIALDAAGDLYVADSGNARVHLLSRSGNQGLGSLVTTVKGSFTTPVAVAVDNLGNLYVADAGSKTVVQIALSTSTQTTILNGMTTPSGVAVDAAGSLYAVDSGTGTITRVPNISGALATASETTLATVVARPVAIALNASGNLYAADTLDASVAKLNRNAGSLNLGTVNVLSSSAAIAAELTDGGPAALVFNTPYETASGTGTSSFAVQSSSTCASGGSVASGAGCTVATIFTPQASGTLSETLTFSSNALNSATLAQTGTGGSLAVTSVGLAVSSPVGSITYGQAVTVQATIIPGTGPTGTVTFYLDTVVQAPAVVLSSGTASFTFSGLTGGAHTIGAVYNGNSSYASSNNSLQITVNLAATTTSTVSLSAVPPLGSNPTSAPLGSSITMSATVTPGVAGTLTGTVNFLNGVTVLASGVSVNGAGLATFTSATLGAGTYSITAAYSGDIDFAGSTSTSGTALQINAPPAGATQAIFSRTNYTSSVNSAPGMTASPDYQGKAGHLAANSRGDVFFDDAPFSYPNTAFVIEIPANGGSQITLLSGLAWNSSGVYADAGNNLWATDNGGNLIYIPMVNGSYPSGATVSSLSTCATPLSSNTTACKYFWQLTAVVGYYVQSADVALDGSGNVYVVDHYDGTTSGANNRILKFAAATGALTLLVDGLPDVATAQLAVDAAGDVYYADGNGAYYFAATSFPLTNGTTSATSIGTGLSGPTGVALDAGGNLYISDTNNDRMVEIPNENGVIKSANQYTLSSGAQLESTHAQSGAGIDGYGNIYYAGNYGNSINHLAIGNLSLGSTTIGNATAAGTLDLYFITPATFGSFSLSGGAGSFAISVNGCTSGQTYAAGSSCTVSLTYTATAAGVQSGAITALDNNGNMLGTATLSGTGQVPLLNVDPAAVSALGSGWTAPKTIAVDASGNTYVADSGSLYMTPAGGSKSAVATGLSSPTAVAVDAAGNLYVAETGSSSNQVVEIPYTNSTYGSPVVLINGLKGASGLALDGLGNLYIADSGNSRVLLLTRSGDLQAQSLVTTVGSGFTTPVALAIDGARNLYVSDAGTNQVVQIAIPAGQQTPILSGLTQAGGVAVDPGGSLYAADTGAGTITRVPNISGALNKNFQSTLGALVAKPVAIAVDSNGNLYAADAADATVKEANRSAGALSFGNVNVGKPSSAISANLSDGGTSALTLSTPYYTASGSGVSSFAVQSTSTCSNGATVNAGVACTVASIFTPQSAGALSETLTFASNATNTGSLVLSGNGVNFSASTLVIAVTAPSGAISYGQSVTFGATLTPAAGSVGTPHGTVTFYVDSVPQAPATLSNEAASLTLTSLTGGAHVITATYNGDPADNFASSASNTLNITVGTAATTTSVVTITAALLYTNPTSTNPGTAVTLTVTIAPSVTGTPTGSVTFTSGSTILGSAAVTPLTVGGVVVGGQASLTSSTLALGTYNITATYTGDTNYNGSASASTVQLLITNPTVTMSASTLNITGNGSPVTITLNSIAGFGQSATASNTVDLACSGLPEYAVCSFTPGFVAFQAGQAPPVTMLVLINQPPVIPPTAAGIAGIPHLPGRPEMEGLIGLCLLLPGALLGFALRRARRANRAVWRGAMLALLLLGCSMIGMNGCGGINGMTFTTPAGQSTITVTATVTPSSPTPNPAPVQTLQFTLTVNK